MAAWIHRASWLPSYHTPPHPSLLIPPHSQLSEVRVLWDQSSTFYYTHSLSGLIQSSGFRRNLHTNETSIFTSSQAPRPTPASHIPFNWHLNMPSWTPDFTHTFSFQSSLAPQVEFYPLIWKNPYTCSWCFPTICLPQPIQILSVLSLKIHSEFHFFSSAPPLLSWLSWDCRRRLQQASLLPCFCPNISLHCSSQNNLFKANDNSCYSFD